jgi:iron(III) transport system permease protein
LALIVPRSLPAALATAPRAGRGTRHLAWLLSLPLALPLIFLAASLTEWQPELWSHISRYLLPQATANTVLLALLLAMLVLIPGLGFAWASARYEYPGRRWLDWALVLPLAIPGYVVAFVYVGLLDYAGPLQSAWRGWFGAGAALPNGRGLLGAAVLLSLVLYPYVYLLARAAFIRQGAAAMDAARSLGYGPLQGFVRAVLPLTRPAWVAGLTLALLEALADFGAVSILGVDTLTTSIYRIWFGMYALGTAAQLALALLGLVALALLIERLARGRARFALAAPAPQPRRQLVGWRGLVLSGFGWLTVLLGFGIPVWRLASWAWQAREALPHVAEASVNTLVLAAMATGLVMAGALALMLIARRCPADHSVETASFVANLGYAVPGTVLAVAVMLMLVRIQNWLSSIELGHIALSSSLVAVLLALSVRFFRVGHGAVEAAFASLRPSVMETARLLEHSPLRRLRAVVLPLLRPGLVAGALLLMVEVMKELPATLMLRPFGWDTLAVRVYSHAAEGLWLQAAWPALLLSLIGLIPVWWLVRHQG